MTELEKLHNIRRFLAVRIAEDLHQLRATYDEESRENDALFAHALLFEDFCHAKGLEGEEAICNACRAAEEDIAITHPQGH